MGKNDNPRVTMTERHLPISAKEARELDNVLIGCCSSCLTYDHINICIDGKYCLRRQRLEEIRARDAAVGERGHKS